MAVAVTNTQGLINASVAITANPATVDTVNGTEVFTITPTAGDFRTAIVIANPSASNGSLTATIAKSTEFWAETADLTLTIEQGNSEVVYIDSARYKTSSGTVLITLTPATGKKLLTDHTATMYVLHAPKAN